jgi:hypothetical protein
MSSDDCIFYSIIICFRVVYRIDKKYKYYLQGIYIPTCNVIYKLSGNSFAEINHPRVYQVHLASIIWLVDSANLFVNYLKCNYIFLISSSPISLSTSTYNLSNNAYFFIYEVVFHLSSLRRRSSPNGIPRDFFLNYVIFFFSFFGFYLGNRSMKVFFHSFL